MKRLKNNPLRSVKEALGANGLIIILVAAGLLVVINILQYRFAHQEINEDLQLRAQSELSAKSLAIQNIMTEVETAVRNHTEDVIRQLDSPDSMFSVARSLVEQNPLITGSAVSFIKNYYPSKGPWFEAYAVRTDSGEIETVQLGNESHDYFKSEFFNEPFTTRRPVWTNPYLDSEGAKMMLTTFSMPVFDRNGTMVAVLDADISLDWLDDILTVEYAYPSSYHVLLSKTGQLMSVADKNYVMKTIPEMGKDYGNNTFEALNIGMLSGKAGETIIRDKKGEKYRAFYMPVDGDTGWSIAIINSEKEIFGDFHRMKTWILWLSIAGFAVIFFLLIRSILNIKRLQKVTTERERIVSELNIARDIQMGMLPKRDTLQSGEEKIDVCGKLVSAKEVGGDLYDYFVKDSYLYFCIGDVSGKGVPASLFMTVTRSLFRTISPYTRDASKILSYMNNSLVQVNDSNMFVTFFAGVLDLRTGRLNYANAGHDAPIILDGHGASPLAVKPNLPLGVYPEYEYESQQIQLRKGSMLFLFTDGVTEAMNSQNEIFGEERTMACLKEIYESSAEIRPEELVAQMILRLRDFAGKAEQSDDITMLAFRFTKPEDYPENHLKITNNITSISKVNEFTDGICRDSGFSESFSMTLKLAIEEAVANVIDYAYGAGEGDIDIKVRVQEEEVLVEIKDRGVAFDPTEVPEVDIETPAEERAIGGLGIHLLRGLTNSLTYRRAGEFNILTFSIKRINNSTFAGSS